MSKLFIIGCGGHGKVILDMAKKIGKWVTIQFLDDYHIGLSINGIKVIGSIDMINSIVNYDYIIAIGDNNTREFVFSKIRKNGNNLISIIDPSATISDTVKIGNGTVIMPNVVINANSIVKDCCIVNTGSIIEHDSIIGSFSHISPGAVLCGNVKIGKNVWIGANTTIINNIKISSDTIIGAGSTVIDDVLIKGTYVGSPIRKLK